MSKKWRRLNEDEVIKKKDVCLNWVGGYELPIRDIIDNKNWVGYTVGEFLSVYPDGTVNRSRKIVRIN